MSGEMKAAPSDQGGLARLPARGRGWEESALVGYGMGWNEWSVSNDGYECHVMIITHAEPPWVKWAFNPLSTSPQTVWMIKSSARSASLWYCTTSSSKIVPSGTSASAPLGSGREGAASARVRSEDLWLISAHNSRKNYQDSIVSTLCLLEKDHADSPDLHPKLPSPQQHTWR